MKCRLPIRLILTGLILAAVGPLRAQGRNLTVTYLRAAIGSIDDRAQISVEGKYSGASGMREARGSYLRGKGYSQFSIADPDTGLLFDAVYCEQDSAVFNELLKLKKSRRFVFHGYKGPGEGRRDSFFVTSLTPVREVDPDPADDEPPKSYRVTIVDNTTSNRVMMMNVELGKPFIMMGSTLIIEEEKADHDKVRILR